MNRLYEVWGAYAMSKPMNAEAETSVLPGWQGLLNVIRERNDLFSLYRREAAAALSSLLAFPAEEREGVVTAHRQRFANPSLVDLLLERCHQALFVDPAEATALARLAVAVAQTLDAERIGTDLARDLELRAEAHLGNALRVQGELRAASATFHALRNRRAEVADPLLVAEILSLLASLRQDQGRLSEASRLLDQTQRIYVSVGDHHLASRTLMKKAFVLDEQDRLDAAISTLSDALGGLDATREPELITIAHHNLACYLTEAGRYDEAESLLAANPLRGQRAPATQQLRQLWLQGRIAAGRGDAARATDILEDAREGFLALSLPYDAALVSFDLAIAHVAAGHQEKVRAIAEEMVATFSALELDRAALAALRLFWDSARSEALSLEQARLGARSFRLSHPASPLSRG